MKAMLFAAGKGTRLKPLTDRHPKCLVQAGGKTLLEHNIDYLKNAGVSTIVVNVHHLAEQVIAFLGDRDLGVEIQISREVDLLETGGGLLKAMDHFKDEAAFVVCNSDIYTDIDLNKMLSLHDQNKNLATLAVADRETSRYLRFDQDALLCGWENRKTDEQVVLNDHPYHTRAFNGLQIMSPHLFDFMAGRGKAFSTIPVFLDAAAAGKRIQAFPVDDAFWIDIGTVEKLELLRTRLSQSS
jgi:MurNAc alpha-1-phosphate uridylyltransferase